jgi:hypothetical protein
MKKKLLQHDKNYYYAKNELGMDEEDAYEYANKKSKKPTNFMQSDTWENFWEVGGKHKDDSMGGVF